MILTPLLEDDIYTTKLNHFNENCPSLCFVIFLHWKSKVTITFLSHMSYCTLRWKKHDDFI